MVTARTGKILLIDDSVEITRLLKIVLAQEGYQVVVANEASAGLQMVGQ